MFTELLGPLFFTALIALTPVAPRIARLRANLAPVLAPVRAPEQIVPASFKPLSREVTNWRREAAGALDLSLFTQVQFRAGGELRAVSRCVRLNNYWCIKRAGWAGEIASDAEGHVAFASAQEGAIVAAVLLRKYYVEYKRHSAQAIVSHWAPANCGFALAGSRRVVSVRALAPRGIRATLRGRWLAAHGRGSVGPRGLAHGPRVRPSVVAERAVPMLRAPTIAVGVSETPVALTRLASLSFSDPPAIGPPSAPLTSCFSETQRIANYAARIIPGLAAGPNDDLGLFGEDGAPTPNLAIMMENMSAVEIGPLKADPALIAGALEQYAAQRKAALEAKK